MKFKLTWIPFVPLALIACFCKLAQGLFPEGALFGLSALMLDYIYMGITALIFIFALIFTLIDKKMARYYSPVRNIPAGLLAILLTLSLAGDGAEQFAARAALGDDLDGLPAQCVRRGDGGGTVRRLFLAARRLLEVHGVDGVRRSKRRQLARQQIVAGIALRRLDHFALLALAANVL